MTFVVDALGGWLVGEVASALTRRVGEHLLGSEQERALHVVGHTAIRNTAAQLAPTNPDHFIMVVSEVFVVEVPADQASPGGTERYATVLEALCAGMAARLAVLGDAALTGTSSVDALGVSLDLLTETLIGQVLQQIRLQAVRGGPLEPVNRQLNDDVTHLQLLDHRRLGLRSQAVLEQLVEQVRGLSERMVPAGSRPALAAPVGQPIDEVHDPIVLEVHPPIDAGAQTAKLPVLPDYIEREHDMGAALLRVSHRAAGMTPSA